MITDKTEDQISDADNKIKWTFSIKKNWPKIWPTLFFLIIGIINAVLMKLIFIIEAEGAPGYGVHEFQKPWWVTMIAFFGMALAVPIYAIMTAIDASTGKNQLIKIRDLSFKDFCEFAIPAMSDIFENIVSAVCVVFVGVSIDSMMKSGTLVGVSLISRFIFHVHYALYKWVSIFFVVVALTMVGAAGIINANDSTTITTSRVWVAVIVVLKFISQIGYAIRISYEEYFARVKHYHPVMICGLEGCWSTAISAFGFMPIAQFLPGPEGNGIHEDSIDTLYQIKNSVPILLISIVMIILSGLYNCVSATLISRTSAVVRTLMEAFRTFLIWMVQFLIFYTFRSNETLYHYRLAGEEWGLGSYIQLAGFVLMTFAILAYNKIPKYPCYSYAYDQYVDNKTPKKNNGEMSQKEESEINLEVIAAALNGQCGIARDEISTTETNPNGPDDITIDSNCIANNEDISDVSVRSMSIGSESDDPELPIDSKKIQADIGDDTKE